MCPDIGWERYGIEGADVRDAQLTSWPGCSNPDTWLLVATANYRANTDVPHEKDAA